MVKVIGMEFTQENRALIRDGKKVETRRKMKKPPTEFSPANTEDVLYWMKEPVQIVRLHDGVPSSPLPWVELRYLDDADQNLQACEITWEDRARLLNRKDWRKPTIARFMLRSLARTWLPGVKVWPEQLKDMTEESAIAEGIEYYDPGDGRGYWQFSPLNLWGETPQEVYKKLWENINGASSWSPEKWILCTRFGKPQAS